MKRLDVAEMYKRHPQLKEDDVKMIKAWMDKQPHLPKITDLEVANFIHANYFRIEPTKIMIDNYYTYRTHLTNLFTKRDITGDDMEMTHDVVSLYMLPERTPENYQVMFYRLKDSDPSKFNYTWFTKIISFAFETELLENGPAEGYMLLMDMEGAKLGHLLKIPPPEIKPSLLYMQEGLPIRNLGFHFLNPVPFMDRLLSIIKPFMHKEFAERLYVHPTLESLHKHIPASVLPREYEGGKAESSAVLHEKYYQYLVERRDYFLEEEKTRRVNEKMRQGKSKVANEFFGVEGSFKKLQID